MRLVLRITRPFGVTRDLGERRPQDALSRYLPGTRIDSMFLGSTYLAVGEKPVQPSSLG